MNVSRAIADLDEHATGHPEKSISDMRLRVAGNIGSQYGFAGLPTHNVQRRDVMAIMASHGASAFTIEQHALAIADLIVDGAR
jgi:hypothetical protein